MRRYRWRTRLRGHLPYRLLWLAPKGEKDCGAHEWHLAEVSDDVGYYECYHCTPGATNRANFAAVQEKLRRWVP